MLRNLQSEKDTLSVLEKIRESLKKPLHIDTHTIVIQAGIGVSMYPESGRSSQEIIHHADQAMYRAKQGKDRRMRWVVHAGGGEGGGPSIVPFGGA
jgi:methyl-accepting chemotaxis protein